MKARSRFRSALRAACFAPLIAAGLLACGVQDPPCDGGTAQGSGGQTTNGLCGAGGQTTNGITARIRSVEGEPAPGAKVYLIEEEAWPDRALAWKSAVRDSAVADARGWAEFKNLPPATYAVQVDSGDRGALLHGVEPGKASFDVDLHPLRQLYAVPPFLRKDRGRLLVEGSGYSADADSNGTVGMRLPYGTHRLFLSDSAGSLREWKTLLLDRTDSVPPDLYVSALHEIRLDDFADGDDLALVWPIAGFGKWIEDSWAHPATSILAPRDLGIRIQGSLSVDYALGSVDSAMGDTLKEAKVALEMRRADGSFRDFVLGSEVEALCFDVRGEAQEFTVQLHDMVYTTAIIATKSISVTPDWQRQCIALDEWARPKNPQGGNGSNFQKIAFTSRQGTHYEIDNVSLRGKALSLF